MFPLWLTLPPHYVNVGILKFPDIVKLHSCLFFFDIFNDFGPSNLTIPLLFLFLRCIHLIRNFLYFSIYSGNVLVLLFLPFFSSVIC